MKNGYYLSIYSVIDPYLNHFNVDVRHDYNLSLWEIKGKNVYLIHHWELERLTGFKHHGVPFYNFNDFRYFLNILLKQYNITFEDIIQIWGTPGITTNEPENNWRGDLDNSYTYHPICHMFTSLFMDSELFYNNKILALSFDGGADAVIDKDIDKKYQFIGAYCNKGEISYFPISSPGPYWIYIRQKFNLEEGSLMALATASESKSMEDIYKNEEIVELYLLNFHQNYRILIDKIINTIFSYSQNDAGIKFNYFDDRFSENENKISMVVKIIQEISIKIVDNIITKAVNLYNIDINDTIISLSGGYALNCPTNTYIMHKYKFKKQLIAPCINDGGQALGMGLYIIYKKAGNINFKFKNAFYGDDDKNLYQVINDNKYIKYIATVEEKSHSFCDDLIKEPFIWFNGRAEIGPRALGHRSIFADPRNMLSKELLNQYKQRQWWRPVAPIILVDCLDEWFYDAFESAYMLNNFKIREDKRKIVPAILHLDNTARVQTISINDDDLLYEQIKKFKLLTGVPIICNTSLNDKGEPIINTVEQALNFALRKNIRILYINGTRILLKDHHIYEEKKWLERNNILFTKHWSNESVFNGMTKQEYLFYYFNSKMYELDIEREDNKEKIKNIFKKFKIN